MMDSALEMTCLQIITNTGSAKSSYIEAIQSARAGLFEDAEKKMEEGEESFLLAHSVHGDLIQKDASGGGTFFADPHACRGSNGGHRDGEGDGPGIHHIVPEKKWDWVRWCNIVSAFTF